MCHVRLAPREPAVDPIFIAPALHDDRPPGQHQPDGDAADKDATAHNGSLPRNCYPKLEVLGLFLAPFLGAEITQLTACAPLLSTIRAAIFESSEQGSHRGEHEAPMNNPSGTTTRRRRAAVVARTPGLAQLPSRPAAT
jgi:hypothetical protein